MTEPTTPSNDSGDISHEQNQSKQPSKVKFTSGTTFNEVLKYNLGELDRSSIINLKKEVMADLAVYMINKLHKQVDIPPKPTECPLLTDIQATCKALKDQIAHAEGSIINKLSDINNISSPKSEHKTPVANKSKILTENVHLDHIEVYKEDFIDESTEKEFITFLGIEL